MLRCSNEIVDQGNKLDLRFAVDKHRRHRIARGAEHRLCVAYRQPIGNRLGASIEQPWGTTAITCDKHDEEQRPHASIVLARI